MEPVAPEDASRSACQVHRCGLPRRTPARHGFRRTPPAFHGRVVSDPSAVPAPLLRREPSASRSPSVPEGLVRCPLWSGVHAPAPARRPTSPEGGRRRSDGSVDPSRVHGTARQLVPCARRLMSRSRPSDAEAFGSVRGDDLRRDRLPVGRFGLRHGAVRESTSDHAVRCCGVREGLRNSGACRPPWRSPRLAFIRALPSGKGPVRDAFDSTHAGRTRKGRRASDNFCTNAPPVARLRSGNSLFQGTCSRTATSRISRLPRPRPRRGRPDRPGCAQDTPRDRAVRGCRRSAGSPYLRSPRCAEAGRCARGSPRSAPPPRR